MKGVALLVGGEDAAEPPRLVVVLIVGDHAVAEFQPRPLAKLIVGDVFEIRILRPPLETGGAHHQAPLVVAVGEHLTVGIDEAAHPPEGIELVFGGMFPPRLRRRMAPEGLDLLHRLAELPVKPLGPHIAVFHLHDPPGPVELHPRFAVGVLYVAHVGVVDPIQAVIIVEILDRLVLYFKIGRDLLGQVPRRVVPVGHLSRVGVVYDGPPPEQVVVDGGDILLIIGHFHDLGHRVVVVPRHYRPRTELLFHGNDGVAHIFESLLLLLFGVGHFGKKHPFLETVAHGYARIVGEGDFKRSVNGVVGKESRVLQE